MRLSHAELTRLLALLARYPNEPLTRPILELAVRIAKEGAE